MVGALSWSNTVDIDFQLSDYHTRREVQQAVNHIQYVGNMTHTSEALMTLRTRMFNYFRRPRGVKPLQVAIVITDGNSDIETDQTAPEAVLLHQAGITVIVVSVGTLTNATELRAIATRGLPRNIFHVDSYTQLVALAPQISPAFCNGQSHVSITVIYVQ